MIDVTTGRWLKENEREDQAAPEEEGLEAPGGVKRKQRVIPIHDVQSAVVANQDITGVKIGMAQHNLRRAGLQDLAQPLGLPDELGNLRALSLHQSS